MARPEGAAGPGLGRHLRAVRHARGLTLVEVARASGLSHPFLSQVERGLANVSLASLRKLALALETSPVELMAAAEGAADAGTPPVEISRLGAAGAPVAGFAQGTARALASGSRPFLPLVVTADGAGDGALFVHAEDEFMLVLSGSIVLELDGEAVPLAQGESAYYRGGVAHRWWSETGAPCEVLVVKQQVSA